MAKLFAKLFRRVAEDVQGARFVVGPFVMVTGVVFRGERLRSSGVFHHMKLRSCSTSSGTPNGFLDYFSDNLSERGCTSLDSGFWVKLS